MQQGDVDVMRGVSLEDVFELTAAYASIDAVSGHEQDLVRRLRDDLAPVVDDVFVDAFGNVVGTRHGEDTSCFTDDLRALG